MKFVKFVLCSFERIEHCSITLCMVKVYNATLKVTKIKFNTLIKI